MAFTTAAPEQAPSVSVVIPVFGGHPTLPELVDRLRATLAARGAQWEVVLVNDGSGAESWRIIADLCQRLPQLRGIDLMRNYGQHNALLAGIRAARFEVIVTMDDDLQHPPEEVPQLLAGLEEGLDLVYGAPQREEREVWRVGASRFVRWGLYHVIGAQAARNASAFRAFRAELRETFSEYAGPMVSIDVLLNWGTTRIGAVDVRHDRRRIGASGYTFRSLVRHALTMVTGFSTTPLRLASAFGFAFTLFGIMVFAWVVIRYLIEGGSVPGFPFLASIVAVFSGVQLFCLGIIGEYLARIYLRSLQRPPYAVRSVAGTGVE